MEGSFRLLATAIVIFFTVSCSEADEVATTAAPPETSQLCISKCGTCPTVCVSPPPPPPPQSPLIILTPPHDLSPPVNMPSPTPPPPSPPSPPPPPPPQVKPYSFSPVTQDMAPPPPASGQKGTPTPYYYFYTSKAVQLKFVFHIWSLIFPLCIGLAMV